MESLAIWEKFNPNERLVKEFRNWIVIIRPKQVTLGACLILPKREIKSIGLMNESEAIEFVDVCRWFENKLTEVFQAERFNYVAAMMKDPFLHFHAFPRYSQVIKKFGVDWVDEAWPKVIEFKDIDFSNEILTNIKDSIRE